MQPSADAVYRYIGQWLGDDLETSNADTASTWPWRHLDAFAEQWPVPSGQDLDAEIPAAAPGELRPVTSLKGRGALRRRTIAGLLLYAPAIVMPADELVQDWHEPGDRDEHARVLLREKLSWLARIRPLVANGTILFSRRLPGDEWSSLIDGLNPALEPRFRALDDMSWDDWNAAGWEWPEMTSDEMAGINRAVSSVMGTSLELVARGAGQPLALDTVESIAFEHALIGRRLVDGRMTALQRLDKFQVPDFSGSFEQIVALRDSDEWERWREAMRTGIELVTEIPDDQDSAREASAILKDHLAKQLLEIDRASRSSTALSALRSGSKGMAVTALGAASVTALTGDPVAMGSAVLPLVADPVGEYLESKRRRRKHKAVIDVLLEFHSLE